VVTAVVADAGHEPLVAGHGRQALELARARWPALVITDLMMPHLDGAELIAALADEAAARGRPRPPVILLTAAGQREARAAGADAVLRKPFDLDALEELVHRLLAADA
jgi:CheY-like chemotaxis protein